jgi:sterol desaturase/sphingolipid hydroxylase (fatty acid hydroxylase superfamily)
MQPERSRNVDGFDVHLTGQGRQFSNDFLEKFSRCHPLVPLLLWGPIAIVAVTITATWGALGVGAALGSAGLGLFAWTFAEYWMHRKIFHIKGFPNVQRFIHGIHHEFPNDTGRIVMPPFPAFCAASVFGLLFCGLLGWRVGLAFGGGFMAGYIWYDLTHAWTHIGKPRTAWGRLLRRHHMLHHFKDTSRRFGVSTPLWDLVFGTFGDSQRDLAAATPEVPEG